MDRPTPMIDASDGPRHSGRTKRSPARAAMLLILAVGLAVGTATALLFVWPRRDTPARADAIVVLGGEGRREAKGLQLAEHRLAPMLVFSETDPPREPVCRLALRLDDRRFDPLQPEALKVADAGTQVSCFRPPRFTTQGESEAVAQLAARYGWHRILVVVSRPQASRARLRLRRCYAGQFLVQTVPIGWPALPRTIAYEWGATIKALVLQRHC